MSTTSELLLSTRQFTLALQEYSDFSLSSPLARLSYRGANLFPSRNPINDELLYLSDKQGTQSLYMRQAAREQAIYHAKAGEHLNGLAWSLDGQRFAYISNETLTIVDGQGMSRSITLTHPVYLRGWTQDTNKLLVNELSNGHPIPAILNITSGAVTRLTDQPASCAVPDQHGRIYYTRGKRLFRYIDGTELEIKTLRKGEYDDLFVSPHYLYASVSTAQGYWLYRYSLSDLTIQTQFLGERMAAGVDHQDRVWLYEQPSMRQQLMTLK
ncbi:hypothetical protein L1285_01990 [Pseudoalteromonas sp. DL2-H2.2]|uniref:hypothetical protein n=1 Tax=Pseudoalteromonas sp. DL2-H2.2 TaxID=2908889 RepID=UPI001F334BE4|nr:hypothetical protein [Pseudoalteromonas sp. DL2-H2.2]MCF2907115.1 hypothetical protein [Pseudoalteromonas sp. DL2-H2.2]